MLIRLAIIFASFYSTSCVYKDLTKALDCSKSDLGISLVSKRDATSCKSIDGQIIMKATGGIGGYDFSFGDGVYQTNPTFDRLAPGLYLVTVKDLNGCKKSVQVDLGAEGSTLNATTTVVQDDQCLTDNGSISVTCSGGTAPYQIKLDDGTFAPGPLTFSNLRNGNHTVIIKDNQDCERILIVEVPRGNTNISLSADIRPILTTNCTTTSGCHGPGNSGRDWTKYSDLKAKAGDIKNRTMSRSMPIGGFVLTTQEIQKIACWVDDGANDN